jgi:acyl carrier protein
MKTQNPEDGDLHAFLPVDNAVESAGARTHPHSAEAIQAWLVARLTKELRVDPQDIDIQKHFSRYGLDSLTTVALICDLEDWLGQRLPDTLVEDYPTIETLVWHLARECDAGRTREEPGEGEPLRKPLAGGD